MSKLDKGSEKAKEQNPEEKNSDLQTDFEMLKKLYGSEVPEDTILELLVIQPSIQDVITVLNEYLQKQDPLNQSDEKSPAKQNLEEVKEEISKLPLTDFMIMYYFYEYRERQLAIRKIDINSKESNEVEILYMFLYAL